MNRFFCLFIIRKKKRKQDRIYRLYVRRPFSIDMYMSDWLSALFFPHEPTMESIGHWPIFFTNPTFFLYSKYKYHLLLLAIRRLTFYPNPILFLYSMYIIYFCWPLEDFFIINIYHLSQITKDNWLICFAFRVDGFCTCNKRDLERLVNSIAIIYTYELEKESVSY